MMETLRSAETSVLTRATRRNILEDSILYSHPAVETSNLIYFNCCLFSLSVNKEALMRIKLSDDLLIDRGRLMWLNCQKPMKIWNFILYFAI
jgi:hypothetical protein